MSQCEQILKYVREHGKITPLDALNYIGCFRLGARIPEINSNMLGWTECHLVNENPMGKHACYRFETEAEKEERLSEQ